MTPLEKDIINTKKVHFMNNLLRDHEFTTEFLIQTREYYNGDVCLMTQENLTPEFCFAHIYDKHCDGDRIVTYDQIEKYLLKNYTEEEIKDHFIFYRK